jgi:hypothetical protein
MTRLPCGWVVGGGGAVASQPHSGKGWAALRRQECLPHVPARLWPLGAWLGRGGVDVGKAVAERPQSKALRARARAPVETGGIAAVQAPFIEA